MKGFIGILILGVTVWLGGCGVTGGAQKTGTISVTNTFPSIQAGTKPVTLTAKVSGGATSLNWSLTYGTFGSQQNCSSICGTLTTSGGLTATYTPPGEAPAFGQATITASSTSDASDVFTFSFMISPAISVSITPKFANILTSSPSVLLTANVSSDSTNAGVTWSLTLGGTNCTAANAATCGTLTPGPAPVFTVTYQPPATLPSGGANPMPTITATTASAISQPRSDSFTFTVVPATTLIQGSYALLLRGYSTTATPMAVAGAITTDGKGNITAGEFDYDNGGGITSTGPITGNYSVDLSFNNITRGNITITNFKFPGSNIGIAFDFVLSADGKRGRVVEFDGSAYVNMGTILQQDSAALSAGPAGSFAFGVDSDAPTGGRIVEAGQIAFSGGKVTGVMDRSMTESPAPLYSDQAISGTAGTPDGSGRGTLTLTTTNDQKSAMYAYYVVNSGQLNLVEIDNGSSGGGVQAGVAYRQNTLTAGSVNTTSVVQLTGNDSGVGPDVLIGVLTISGGNQFSVAFDENDLGRAFRDGVNGAVAFDPSTGRGTLSDPCGIGNVGGFNSGFMDSGVIYMYDQGKGFLIDGDVSANPNPTCPAAAATPISNLAFSGTFTPQASTPFTAATISGNMIVGSGATAIPDIPDMAAAVVATPSNQFGGNLSGDGFVTTQQLGNFPNITFSGTYSVPTDAQDAALGYGTALLPGFIFGDVNNPYVPQPASFYIIGPNQFVLIGGQAGITGTQSGVSFFDPQ